MPKKRNTEINFKNTERKKTHGVFFPGLEDMAHCLYNSPLPIVVLVGRLLKITFKKTSRDSKRVQLRSCSFYIFLWFSLEVHLLFLLRSSSSIGLFTDTHILPTLQSHFISPQLQSPTALLLSYLSTKQQCPIPPVPRGIVLAAAPAGRTSSRVSHWNAWSSLSSPKFHLK